MAIPKLLVGDIVQVTIQSRCLNQTILNVLHYRAKVGLPEITYQEAMAQLGEAVAGPSDQAIVTKLLNALSQNCTVQEVRVQRVYPTRDPYVIVDVSLPGEDAEDCTATNVSAVITKQCERAGRGRAGSFHVGGLPYVAYDAGRITDPFRAILLDVADKLNDPYVTTGAESVFEPGTFNPALGAGLNFNPIIGTFVQDTLRVMRRRTVGLGI